MKAMVLNQYGPDAKFEQAEINTPHAQAGQVIVRVAAISVNTVDTMIRQMGADLPPFPLSYLLFWAWTLPGLLSRWEMA